MIIWKEARKISMEINGKGLTCLFGIFAAGYAAHRVYQRFFYRPTFSERLEKINYTGKIPEEYCCCILSGNIMDIPVTASDGYTYDRSTLDRFMVAEENSPLTRVPFKWEQCKTNTELQNAIKEFVYRAENKYILSLYIKNLHEKFAKSCDCGVSDIHCEVIYDEKLYYEEREAEAATVHFFLPKVQGIVNTVTIILNAKYAKGNIYELSETAPATCVLESSGYHP